jgi:hypothetical protein
MKVGSLIEKTFEHDVRPMLQHLTYHFYHCQKVDRYLTYMEIAIKSSLRVRATEIAWIKLEDALREITTDCEKNQEAGSGTVARYGAGVLCNLVNVVCILIYHQELFQLL